MVSALAMTGMMLTFESSFFMQTRSMLLSPWPLGVTKYRQAWTRVSWKEEPRFLLILSSSWRKRSNWVSR